MLHDGNVNKFSELERTAAAAAAFYKDTSRTPPVRYTVNVSTLTYSAGDWSCIFLKHMKLVRHGVASVEISTNALRSIIIKKYNFYKIFSISLPVSIEFSLCSFHFWRPIKLDKGAFIN